MLQFFSRRRPSMGAPGVYVVRACLPFVLREAAMAENDNDEVRRTEEEWRKLLSPAQFRILRQQGTEPAFTGAFWDSHDPALYLCGGGGAELLGSLKKVDSG